MNKRIERIGKIKNFLRFQSGGVTVSEIHEAMVKRMGLDISRKTIERDIIDMVEGKEDAVETLVRFLKDCNEKDYGRKVTVSEIIARGIRKLDAKDLELLQDQTMGVKDSLKQKYKTDKGVEASEDDFVRWLLEEYQPQKNKKKLN
jgi:hypothetical protein